MFERRLHALITGSILIVSALLTVITAIATTPPWQSFEISGWRG